MIKNISRVTKIFFCLLLVNSLANAGTITFSDDFEAQSIDPFWANISQQYGTVSLSSDQAHSGSQSAKFSSTSGGQRYIWLKHEFPNVMEGNVSVWFYDTAPGQQTLYAQIRVYNTTITYPEPGSHFDLGVMDWDGGNYWFGGPSDSGRTSISRTAGWHKFEIKISSTGGQMFIDDILVDSFTGDFGFNAISLVLSGPGWRPNATYYFDDFSLNAVYNSPPVAHAGSDQAITLLNTEVQLDGTGSYDDDGDTITYDWNITQKPVGSSAVLSNTTSATPTFTPDVYGDYVIGLTVSDPTETGSTDSVTISFDNVKPVANAGGNKSILVGETAVLDGTGSTDANGDPLTFSWTLVSKPAGSTATLSSLTNTTTSFVGDTSGTYDVNLTVNDGLLDSDPNTASILTITVLNAMTQVLNDTMDAINDIPPADLKNPNMANALTGKINAVLKMIEQEQYQGALDKLTNDILTKTDGCANGGEPDKNDWIKTCAEQEAVYNLLLEAISIVESQI